MNKIIFLLVILSLTLCSCRYSNNRRVKGNGKVQTDQREVVGFTGVETNGSIDIVVSQGPYKVSVKADENLLQYIVTPVVNGRMQVRFKSNLSIRDYSGVTVYVSAPEMNEFESHGSGNIIGEGRITDSHKMKIKVFGSGDIKLDIDCPDVESEIHASGTITITGETRNFAGVIQASGDLWASNLKAEIVKVSVHASGTAEVFASESLKAEIFASGDVRYKGDPKLTTSIHASGSVSKME